MRVRVEGSTNRLTTVLPRNAGTFLDRPLADRLEGARGVQHRQDLLGGERLDVQKMFSVPGHAAYSLLQRHFVRAALLLKARLRCVPGSTVGDVLADKVRLDRQFAVAAIHQDRQLNPFGAGQNRSRHPAPPGSCAR